jgi:hypothetical protein
LTGVQAQGKQPLRGKEKSRYLGIGDQRRKEKTTQPRCNGYTDVFDVPGGRKKTLTQAFSVFNCFKSGCCRGLFRMVFLRQFALESVFARSRAIELPHDKAVFFNEIINGLVLVLDPMEPFMLVNVALDDIYLSIQNIMEMFAFVEHGSPERVSIC